MSMAVNKVILVGFLGRDPEVKFNERGSRVARFSLATSELWGDRAEKHEHTEWHTVAAWNRLAEIAEAYLRRGSKVYVEGCLRHRRWQGSDGATRVRSEVMAERLLLLDPPPGVMTAGEKFDGETDYDY